MRTFKLLLLSLLVAIGLYAQVPSKPTKSKIDGTVGAVTLQATSAIDQNGHWTTKLYLSSPNTMIFMICLRYFDGTGTRSIIKTATADAGNLPATIILPVPLEVVEAGSLYVYELMPASVVEFGQ